MGGASRFLFGAAEGSQLVRAEDAQLQPARGKRGKCVYYVVMVSCGGSTLAAVRAYFDCRDGCFITYSRVWINRVSLPILLVVS